MANMWERQLAENEKKKSEAAKKQAAAQEQQYRDSVIKLASGGGLPNFDDMNAKYQQALDGLLQQQTEFQNKVTGMTDAGGRRFEQSEIKYDSKGRPITQAFESTRDASGGLLDPYKVQAGGDVTMNRDALDAMRAQGLAEGDSPWAQMMKERQAVEQAMAMDKANQGTANQLTQAQGLLAQSGGLGGAGRTSLARQAMRQGAGAQQDVRRQGLLDRLSIGVEDQQMKNNLLGQIQQGEGNMANLAMQNRQYQTGVDQFNVGNALKDVEQKRMYDANNYNQAMQGWAANKSADAQAKAAKSQGGKK